MTGTPALSREQPRDRKDAALDVAWDALWAIWLVTSVPPHKRTDTEFLRGTAVIANEQAYFAMQRIAELRGER